MQGGYNVNVLTSLLDDPMYQRQAYLQLKNITLIFDSFHDIEEKYKNASGLIISSLREGGPRVLLEAINHEIPVLGSKVGIMEDLIVNELLSEPNDQESLQSLLEEMVPMLPQMNLEAVKMALVEGYSISNAAEKIKDIYTDLLNASL